MRLCSNVYLIKIRTALKMYRAGLKTRKLCQFLEQKTSRRDSFDAIFMTLFLMLIILMKSRPELKKKGKTMITF